MAKAMLKDLIRDREKIKTYRESPKPEWFGYYPFLKIMFPTIHVLKGLYGIGKYNKRSNNSKI
jgi:hypothetical protein